MGFKFNDQNIHHDNVKLLDAQSGVSWDGHIKCVKLSVGCEYKAIKTHSVSKKNGNHRCIRWTQIFWALFWACIQNVGGLNLISWVISSAFHRPKRFNYRQIYLAFFGMKIPKNMYPIGNFSLSVIKKNISTKLEYNV